MVALAVFQRATGEQLWRMLRPHHRHDRITRNALNDLRRRGLVRAESRLPSGHQLWVLTVRGHAEAKSMLPAGMRMSALRPGPPAGGAQERPRGAGGFDAHAAAVTATAAHLIGAGFGTVLSCETEVAHKLPYGYTQYADLVLRAPDAGVPVLLVEVDRGTEPVDELVAKLRRYAEWFRLPATRSGTDVQRAAWDGAEAHGFRLWSRVYPATGREGFPPVAFVFTDTTAARRKARMERFADAARAFWRGRRYPDLGDGVTAVDYHQAVPVVVTELERIAEHGADGPVWWRLSRGSWQTLTEALDNPDGDRLYKAERAAADVRAKERMAAEREARRPVCSRCAGASSDDRWEMVQSHRLPQGHNAAWCGPCQDTETARTTAEQLTRAWDARLEAGLCVRQARNRPVAGGSGLEGEYGDRAPPPRGRRQPRREAGGGLAPRAEDCRASPNVAVEAAWPSAARRGLVWRRPPLLLSRASRSRGASSGWRHQ
ncbi:replication-relaxation family protein [Yinghuangia aomiensis]|uniref:replication-relaxation family protein n=1 Tax=Yinghuangia aomiensis TaxID=676205 RepID=UPI0031E872B1